MALSCAMALSAAAQPRLTTLADLKAAAGDDMPFEVEGKLLFSTGDSISSSIAVTDGREYLTLYNEATNGATILPGDQLIMRGMTDISAKTGYRRNVKEIAVVRHGESERPAAISAEEFNSAKFLMRPVELRGVLRELFCDEVDPKYHYLAMDVDGAVIIATTAIANPIPTTDIANKLGSTITLRGICGRIFPLQTRPMLFRHLSTSEAEVRRALASAVPPEAQPLDIAALKETTPNKRLSSRLCRARGRVLAVRRGRELIIMSDEGKATDASLFRDDPPQCGQMIEVVGFPSADIFNVSLTQARWRPLPEGEAALRIDETPVSVSARKMMTNKSGALMIKTDFHGRLIKLRGIVRNLPPASADFGAMYIEDGGFLVRVETTEDSNGIKGVEPGSEVEVTGTCAIDKAEWRPNTAIARAKGFIVVTRQPSDVVVLRRPPWWTPGKLFVLLAAMLAGMLAIFAWNVSLRRLAEQRGRHLAEEHIARAETDMKVMERTRLAVELHDSVAQNLTAVAMELETARQFQDGAPHDMLDHLGIAWRTLKSCRDELRNCLWDLRSRALEEQDMETAVRRTLLPHVKGIDLLVRFKVPRSLISDNTTHAILRIIRELALNGIRHGKAKTIRVAGSVDNGALAFSVQDDGCGFDPDNHPSVAEGHFGLQGVRERTCQLAGTLSIKSRPGCGTKTVVTIPIPKGDNNDQSSAD